MSPAGSTAPPRADDDAPESTARRILDTAERLFADQGFHSTTLRQITREAGVNLAAVNYHHGSKDALILAVFQRRLDELNSERLTRLRAAMEAADPPQLEDVLEAFIHPALRMGSDSSGDGGRFMRLLMRAWAENATQIHRVIRRQYSHVMRTFADAVSRSLGTAPENLRQQLDFLIGALTYTMAETHDDAVEDTARALIRFGCAGLRDSISTSSSDVRSDSISDSAAASAAPTTTLPLEDSRS
ncbi:TetR/AcrR family transcriptional regulator [Wenzhouxiangella sp. XN79A]|uniref:TetR/AcrR family transcriptional regulator n=1 Tax=Wenzhouxiangella sp. XN79A TaxID=2724193 RepID=UPI00144A4EA5|nr:TetR/AcrR family transcriptional regulator [Wenzhouxiangella sp. XN79A]NKI34558.1 TetR/AcrR family transcriptional regulator [Wenzhouxiangella sp. XN79A]